MKKVSVLSVLFLLVSTPIHAGGSGSVFLMSLEHEIQKIESLKPATENEISLQELDSTEIELSDQLQDLVGKKPLKSDEIKVFQP